MNSQIQFETNGLTVLACRVPDTACDFIVNHRFFYYSMPDDTEPIDRFYNLPEGNWKLHAVTTEITNELAKVLVEKMPWGEECYKNYVVEKVGFTQFVGLSPKKSLNTLFACHGIDPAEKWVLLVCE